MRQSRRVSHRSPRGPTTAAATRLPNPPCPSAEQAQNRFAAVPTNTRSLWMSGSVGLIPTPPPTWVRRRTGRVPDSRPSLTGQRGAHPQQRPLGRRADFARPGPRCHRRRCTDTSCSPAATMSESPLRSGGAVSGREAGSRPPHRSPQRARAHSLLDGTIRYSPEAASGPSKSSLAFQIRLPSVRRRAEMPDCSGRKSRSPAATGDPTGVEEMSTVQTDPVGNPCVASALERASIGAVSTESEHVHATNGPSSRHEVVVRSRCTLYNTF